MKRGQKQTAFTIVELLIVIVVIGILAALVISTYSGVQARARDAKRKTDINAIAKALEVNYINHGAYTQPEKMCSDYSTGGQGNCGDTGGTGDWDANSNIRDLITDNDGLTKAPVDPINDSTYYYSYEPLNGGEAGYTTGGQGYNLCARLETGGNYCIVKRQ